MLPHQFRRSFVKFLGSLTTDNGTKFAPVLIMGSFSEVALMLVPAKIEQTAGRFGDELPEDHIPYIFYIGNDDIPPHFEMELPNGQKALVANIGEKYGEIFFTPFLMKYIRWLCRVRDRIIAQGYYSRDAQEEWAEYQEELLSENPVYMLYACNQEEVRADVHRIYNAMKDEGLLENDDEPFDPYEYNGVDPHDFF